MGLDEVLMVAMSIYICIYIYGEREIERDRERDPQTDRQTDRGVLSTPCEDSEKVAICKPEGTPLWKLNHPGTLILDHGQQENHDLCPQRTPSCRPSPASPELPDVQ